MIEIPIYLAVLQWVILLSLALLLVILYRQLARHLGVGVASPESGLAIGSSVEAFHYVPISGDGGEGAVRFPTASGRPSFLLFADPSCEPCDRAVGELEQAVRTPLFRGVEVLVVTTEPDTHLAASDVFRATPLPLGRIAEEVRRGYRVDVTPFAYGIDRHGIVRAHATPGSVEDLEAVARAASVDGEVDAVLHPQPSGHRGGAE